MPPVSPYRALTVAEPIADGEYVSVAASQTTPGQALGKTGGAVGDVLYGLLILPATTGAGAVSVKDGSGTAITIFIGGGTTALADLKPFWVMCGFLSTVGSWQVITGANVSVIAVGKFT